MIKEELILKIRKMQTFISIILFFIITSFFLTSTEYNITEIQISEWGSYKNLGWIFNYSLIILSLSIFVNAFFYIKHHQRLIKKRISYSFFLLTSIFLFFTGFFDVENNNLLHNLSAFSYFFSYPLGIFLLSYINRKKILYREWVFNLLCSISAVILPIIFIKNFDGMGIGELVHCTIISYWNLRINFKFT
jgi:hypothetical protein